jgi:hypothetical protein
MSGALLALLLSGSPIVVLAFLICCIVYLVIDLALIISLVNLYRGSGWLGSRRAVYWLAILSAVCGIYFLSDLEGDWWQTLLTALALPTLAALLATVKSAHPRNKA